MSNSPDERGLDRILGPVGVPEDQARHRIEVMHGVNLDALDRRLSELYRHRRGRLLQGEADYQLHVIYLWYERQTPRALQLLRRRGCLAGSRS